LGIGPIPNPQSPIPMKIRNKLSIKFCILFKINN
jgi:hypothetical protein